MYIIRVSSLLTVFVRANNWYNKDYIFKTNDNSL